VKAVDLFETTLKPSQWFCEAFWAVKSDGIVGKIANMEKKLFYIAFRRNLQALRKVECICSMTAASFPS
jgi:hypothetical protein